MTWFGTIDSPLGGPSTVWWVDGDPGGAGANKFLRRGQALGPPSALQLVSAAIAIPVPDTDSVTALIAGMHNPNLAYLATTTVAAPQVHLYRVDGGAGTMTEVWNRTVGSSRINHLWMLTESEIYFCLRNDAASMADVIYRSTDGLTFVSIGAGSGVLTTAYAVTAFLQPSSSSGRRVMTEHDNTGGGGTVISVSDDLGVSWQDAPGTAINNFASGGYGFIQPFPDDTPTPPTIRWANANGGGGIQTPLSQALIGITLNPQMTSILDSAFLHVGFYLRPGVRFLTSSNRDYWVSTNDGATWPLIGSLPSAGIMRTHLFSILPAKDWLAIATPGAISFEMTTDYGQTWQQLATPNRCYAVAFVGGRN